MPGATFVLVALVPSVLQAPARRRGGHDGDSSSNVKPMPIFLAAWILAGLGAVTGSILGNAAGKSGLVVGATAGGILGVTAAVGLASKFQWLARADRSSGLIGGIIGFVVAAPVAVANLHTPVTPVLICALAGAGVLLGVGFARGWRRSS